jgi:hypothetical protein
VQTNRVHQLACLVALTQRIVVVPSYLYIVRSAPKALLERDFTDDFTDVPKALYKIRITSRASKRT